MRVLVLLLVLLWLLDGVRLRRRLAALAWLPPSDGDEDPDRVVLAAPGVGVSEAVRRDASAYSRQRGLTALDLVPGDLGVEPLLGLLSMVDPESYRTAPFHPGRTAGQALLVEESLLSRARLPGGETESTGAETDETASDEASDAKALVAAVTPAPATLARTALTLKHHAPQAMSQVIVSGLRARAEDPRERRAVLEVLFHGWTGAVLAAQAVMLGLVALALLTAPAWGLLALAVYHLQPVLVTAGQGVQPHDLTASLLFRWPRAVWALVVAFTSPTGDAEADSTGLRESYATELAEGLDRFFEPRVNACPLCASDELSIHLVTRDLLQEKPGRFVIERCGGCEHLFQNPRLSLDGLAFYYRDFYDGLGERSMESVFGASKRAYSGRARMVSAATTPRRWLDVGAGHGHFCLMARSEFPDTRFEALDLSESIEEGERRGWFEKGHRGLFPELAQSLGEFDIVSMSHYLEHTREPEAEIAAAARVLPGGGFLLVEVPDPESGLGRLLGRWWLPWFQPQHQHFLSVANLERLLRAHGFEPERWERGEAHQGVDFFFAAWLWVARLAGSPGRPWNPPSAVRHWVRHDLVWVALWWLLPLGWLTDRLTSALLRRPGWSNTYRVLARRLTSSG